MKKLFMLVAPILLLNHVFATIRQTTVNEEVTTAVSRSYDIDNDGDNDFIFTASDAGGITGTMKFYVNCYKSTDYYAAEGTSDTLPKAYSEGAGQGTFHWQNTRGLVASNTIGNFNNGNKYLMIKFNDVASHTYYGWINIQNIFGTTHIVSFAYSDIPDEVIKPGETESTGIGEMDPASFQLASFNGRTIAFRDCSGYDKVEIYAPDGKTIAMIPQPVAQHSYAIEATAVGIVAFFREGRMLYATRYGARKER